MNFLLLNSQISNRIAIILLILNSLLFKHLLNMIILPIFNCSKEIVAFHTEQQMNDWNTSALNLGIEQCAHISFDIEYNT